MSLIQFCEGEREHQVISMTENGAKTKHIAAAMSINVRTVNRIRERVRKRASIQGYNPDYGMTQIVPNEYYVKGTSTLYGKDGAKKLEWIKTNVKAEELGKIARERVESI
ncbi:MAG: hypothetical protein JHC38_01985, partial [Thiotrichales bacterium]|nr:hypothetical protein [Thiotrichales bacterium]